MKYLIVWPLVTLLRILLTLWVFIFTALYHTVYFVWHLKIYQETVEDKEYTVYCHEYNSTHNVLNDYIQASFLIYNPRQSVTWDHYLYYVWNRRPNRVRE